MAAADHVPADQISPGVTLRANIFKRNYVINCPKLSLKFSKRCTYLNMTKNLWSSKVTYSTEYLTYSKGQTHKNNYLIFHLVHHQVY